MYSTYSGTPSNLGRDLQHRLSSCVGVVAQLMASVRCTPKHLDILTTMPQTSRQFSWGENDGTHPTREVAAQLVLTVVIHQMQPANAPSHKPRIAIELIYQNAVRIAFSK